MLKYINYDHIPYIMKNDGDYSSPPFKIIHHSKIIYYKVFNPWMYNLP